MEHWANYDVVYVSGGVRYVDAETLEERLAHLIQEASSVKIDHYELSRYDRGVVVLALKHSLRHYQEQQDLPKTSASE